MLVSLLDKRIRLNKSKKEFLWTKEDLEEQHEIEMSVFRTFPSGEFHGTGKRNKSKNLDQLDETYIG